MSRIIYADNAATTRMSQTALSAMLPYLGECYGNPSSLHRLGREAGEALDAARKTVADCIGCGPEEIFFTSGGSESDNQAILSAACLGARTGKKHIVSTRFEHEAVLRTLEKLRGEGFEITLLDVAPVTGRLTPQQVAEAIRPDTCLVSVMYANNEIGTILPVEAIGQICRDRGVLFHTDAVQAAGHLPIRVREQNIDMLSASAHKFHGPKGVGFLYCRKGTDLTALVSGGPQERGKRAGTENVPGIAGMAAALRESCGQIDADRVRVSALRDRLITALEKIPGASLNGDRYNRLPGNVNFCFDGIESESLVLQMDLRGICASSGSACTAGSLEPSHVLLAIGRDREAARSSLRLSICGTTTEEDIGFMVSAVTEAVDYLRNRSPLWQNRPEKR